MFNWLKKFFCKLDEKHTETFYVTEKQIRENLYFLTEEYDLRYQYQEFTNCFGGYWYVETFSFYNENGCFTFHYIPQRGEFDIYYSQEFFTEHKKLIERHINETDEFGENVWQEERKLHKGVRGYALYFKVIAELIRRKIENNGEVFGIKVNKK